MKCVYCNDSGLYHFGGTIVVNCKYCSNKKSPQNLPKAETHDSLLAEVRALKKKRWKYQTTTEDGKTQEYCNDGDIFNDGYNTAIDDALKKLSEHFG